MKMYRQIRELFFTKPLFENAHELKYLLQNLLD